jgi:hypothetical protein
MVLTIHIDRWDESKILVDNGSQAEILFLSGFEKMGYDKKQLKEPTKPLYGVSGKRIEPVGVITLPISFSTPRNPHTEYVTFHGIDMLYPYNDIFGRGLLNTFKAVLHSAYLCLKVTATFSIITVFDSKKEARNIERGFAPGHKNVHFLREDTNHQSSLHPNKKYLQNSRKQSKPKVIAPDWHLTLEYQTELYASELR